MGLDEDAVGTGRHGRAGHVGDELGAATGHAGGLVGLLQAVGQVHDGRGEGPHGGEATEVDHEVLVAEGGAAFGDPRLAVAAVVHLGHGVLHGLCAEELALLDVDHLAGLRCGDDQVGLAAEKGGNLQDIDVGRGEDALLSGVDIRGDGESEPLADGGQDAEGNLVADAGEAVDAGAVGLAVAALEDQGQIQRRAGLREVFRDAEGHVLSLDRAGPGDDLEAVSGGPAGLRRRGCGSRHGAKVVKAQKVWCQFNPNAIRPPDPGNASQRVDTANVPPGRPWRTSRVANSKSRGM